MAASDAIDGSPPQPEAPFLQGIGFVVTYRCQVACEHCLLEAGPHRTEEIWLDEALGWLGDAARYRHGAIKTVLLTGGEPFYNLDLLERLSSTAASHGMPAGAVTNAFWATGRARAIEVLQSLPGLRMLSISADAYHQRAIPFERVAHAVAAADACGIPYTVAVCTEDEEDPAHQATLRALAEITDPRRILPALTFPLGRGRRLGSCALPLTEEPPASACASAHTPVIFPDGRVVACVGPAMTIRGPHPLELGNVRREPLGAILDRAEHNVVLHALRLWGPKKIIALARAAGLRAGLPQQYVRDSVCHACHALLSNPECAAYLSSLAADRRFARKVAYGRVFYLGETAGLQTAGLSPTPAVI